MDQGFSSDDQAWMASQVAAAYSIYLYWPENEGLLDELQAVLMNRALVDIGDALDRPLVVRCLERMKALAALRPPSLGKN